MDKRFKPIALSEQLALRRKAIEEVLQHPEWTLAATVRHIRTTLRLTIPEFARLTKVCTHAFTTIASTAIVRTDYRSTDEVKLWRQVETGVKPVVSQFLAP